MCCTTSTTEDEVVHIHFVKLVYAPAQLFITDRSNAVVFCRSLLPVFSVRVSATFRLTCVHIILVWFGLLSVHLLGNSYLLGLPYALIVFLLFVINVISRFGFEGWIWVLYASFADLFIPFTFNCQIWLIQNFMNVLV